MLILRQISQKYFYIKPGLRHFINFFLRVSVSPWLIKFLKIILLIVTRKKFSLLKLEIASIISFFSLGGYFISTASACVDASVRDAAFLDERDVHRLCVMGEFNDASTQANFNRLEKWLKISGMDLNVALTKVAANDTSVNWEEYGIPSAPPAFPVTVFAGSRFMEKKRFYIHHWEPAPTDEELEELISSPACREIKNSVIKNIAVLLYVKGVDEQPGSAKSVLDSIETIWSKKESLGVSIAIVDRADRRERILLSFLGVENSQSDWVGVVFGRGKLMPPLAGEEITVSALNELIELLIGECTCLRSPSSFGVDIPMVWDENLDRAVVPFRMKRDLDGTLMSSTQIIGKNKSIFEWKTLSSTIWTLSVLILIIGFTAVIIVRYRYKK